MKRLAILSTHPIQYNAPLFRILHEDEDINLQVFFSKTWDQVKFDPDFQREVVWDIPVSEGYPHITEDASTKSGQKSLAAAIREFRAEALLVYGWNFPGHLAMMRTFHGSIPIWFRGDSHRLNPQPLWKQALRRLTLCWVYQHVSIAFYVGKANEEYFLWSGVPHAKLIRAPHAVDNDYWEQNDSHRKAAAVNWRKKLGIPTDAPVVGFAGKLEPLKQVGPLMEAVLQTHSTHLVIAGSGPLEKQLKEQANGSNRVHFLGFVNQSKMPIFYRLINVLALVSYSETWGLCINEALASGTPCIISDRAGCAADLAPSEWAVTVEAITHKNWAQTITTQLQIKNRSLSWKENFLQEYSPQYFVDEIKRALAQ